MADPGIAGRGGAGVSGAEPKAEVQGALSPRWGVWRRNPQKLKPRK